MKKNYLVIPGMIIFTLVSFDAAFGMSCCAEGSHEEHGEMSQTKSIAVDAGNKICPVLGEKIDEAVKVTYEYEGKIYNFCCAACVEEFKKEPQKYIDKVNLELQSNQGAK